MKGILDVSRKDGVPKAVPLMVTESHLAAGLTGPMTTVFGGLWLADSVASFFEGGGAVYYHSPIQPQGVQSTCLGWGSWSNFVSDDEYTIKGYTATYWAAHMLNLEWVAHRSGGGQRRGWRGSGHVHAAESLGDRVAGQVGVLRALKQSSDLA